MESYKELKKRALNLGINIDICKRDLKCIKDKIEEKEKENTEYMNKHYGNKNKKMDLS